jgi:hypothetical protein
VRRLWRPKFSWRGGVRGFDRPLDRPFVQIQRRSATGSWQTVDSDLGLTVLWTVDENGLYRAQWEPPLSQPTGTYRFRVTANRYGLVSRSLKLYVSRELTPRRVAAPSGRVAVVLNYPPARVREDVGDPAPDASASLTDRPPHAPSGVVTFIVNGRPVTVNAEPGGRFEVPAAPGAQVEIPAGNGRDGLGNRTGVGLTFQA